jgi:hypothetical protein
MDMTDIRRQRLHNQGLVRTRFGLPEDVVRWNVAVQAQDYPGSKWGIGQRLDGTVDTDLDRLYDAGTILRTHVLRPTWHFVLPVDLRWLLALSAPRVHAANRSRYRELELDGATLVRGCDVIDRAIADAGPLTRQDLGTALEAAGIDPTGQRLTYLVMHAELEAVVCSGPRRGKQHTYARFDDRVPLGNERSREEAVAELTTRYFVGHGPATPHDFAWWSGLTVTDARRGFAASRDHLQRATVDGAEWWFAADRPTESPRDPLLHLLPAWDEYVVGFRNHDPTWAPAVRAMQHPKGPLWNANLIAADGMVIGGWRRRLAEREVHISPILPIELNPDHRRELGRAADAYGRFLGRQVSLECIASGGL